MIFSSITEYHIRFERIHPFSDGNGRTGRMIMNQQLINNDMLPITIDKTSKYRQAFRAYEKNGDHIVACLFNMFERAGSHK